MLLDAVAVKSRQLRTMPNTSLQDTVYSVLLGKKPRPISVSDPSNGGCVLYTDSKIKKNQ